MRRVVPRATALAAAAFIAWVIAGASPAGYPSHSSHSSISSQGGRGGREFDQDAVDRGAQLLVRHCGFCHGSNARGAAGGPDLLRSPLVMEDENGKQLGEFLKVGRPDKGMPKVELTSEEVADLATFLHSRIAAAANRGAYKILNILTGDPSAGQAFFNGAGKCSTCHSTTGDLKGIGAKYDPVTLQSRLVMPPRGRGAAGRGGSVEPQAPPITVTVTLPSGESISGALVRLTDFDVTLREASGAVRAWLRDGDTPKVVVTDPLKAHFDMLTRWTDADMHDVTAYLASLR
jgi:cytochrome c oxidase cbb3-type subunit 3